MPIAPFATPASPRRFDAVICDIDGCLSPEASEPMNAAALAKIAEYNRLAQEVADRPVVTLCSGRPQPFVEAMARLIGNHSLPCVAENGVWLYHPGSNRYDMDPRITRADLRMVQAAREWVEEELGPRGVVMQPGKHASISLWHADAEFLRSLEAQVREKFRQRGWGLRVSMTWFYINCDLEHVSKGTAIDRLVEQTGLGRGRLAGIGDTGSDLAIAERVGFFACPANAVEEVKARANMVVGKAEVEGVLEILEGL
jgi:hydroxymethylpyrimidine pyrophosphatase-like HAD family hydrolase